MDTRYKLRDSEAFEVLDIREVFATLWKKKILISVVTLSFAVASVLYSLSLPNKYKATMVLAPAQNEASALSSSARQLGGGLASLTGFGIGTGKSTEAQIAVEIMKSWSFIDKFIREEDISVEVFAGTGIDGDSGDLVLNPKIFNIQNDAWVFQNNLGSLGPTSWDLFQTFSNFLMVSQDRNTGLITVEIEFFSAQIAHDWILSYVASINEYMQQRQIAKVSNNVSYLQNQIKATSITEMEDVFYTIIEEQIKKKMLAEASPEYVFVEVSPSMVPETKSGPQRAYISILGTLLGSLMSVLIVLIQYFLKNNKLESLKEISPNLKG